MGFGWDYNYSQQETDKPVKDPLSLFAADGQIALHVNSTDSNEREVRALPYGISVSWRPEM